MAMETFKPTPHPEYSREGYYPHGCPRCHFTVGFKRVTPGGAARVLRFILGGFIPYLVYGAEHDTKLQCENCALVFRPKRADNYPTRREIICVVILLLAIIVMGAYILILRTQQQ